MITRTEYICEVCGTSWDSPEDALLCEQSEPPPCGVKAGDEILVYARYGDPKPDIVQEVRLVAGTSVLAKANAAPWYPYHVWKVRTRDYHQLGKDDSTRDVELRLVHFADGRCCTPWPENCYFCDTDGAGDGSRGYFERKDGKRVRWEA